MELQELNTRLIALADKWLATEAVGRVTSPDNYRKGFVDGMWDRRPTRPYGDYALGYIMGNVLVDDADRVPTHPVQVEEDALRAAIAEHEGADL